jgi:hypothetical protein
MAETPAHVTPLTQKSFALIMGTWYLDLIRLIPTVLNLLLSDLDMGYRY